MMTPEEHRHLEVLELFDESNRLTGSTLQSFIKGNDDFKYSAYIKSLNEIGNMGLFENTGVGAKTVYILNSHGVGYKQRLRFKKRSEEIDLAGQREAAALDRTLKLKTVEKIEFDKKHSISTRKISVIALIFSGLSLIAFVVSFFVRSCQDSRISEQSKQVSGQVKHFQDSVLEEVKKDTSRVVPLDTLKSSTLTKTHKPN